MAEKLNYHLYEGIGPRHLHKDTPLKSMLVGGSSGKMVSRVAYYKAQRENGFAAGDHNWWKDGSGGYITKRTVPIAVSHPACPSHCCAKHGCKYGYDDCPVVLGLDPGIECERCELDADVHKACDDRIEELEARLADYEKES